MKNITIVDRVVERIKLQPIGDLIQEEDLYDIIKEAIPKAFFERQVTKDSYGRESSTKDPVIVEVMRELLKDNAAKAVKDWMTENSEQVIDYWKQVMDNGLVTYVQKIQNQEANRHIESMLFNLIGNINQERSRMGMSHINM